jgi:hypothetical protein
MIHKKEEVDKFQINSDFKLNKIRVNKNENK